MHKGIFIDDQEPVYAETLSTDGELKFTTPDILEVAVLSRSIIKENPIIVALDYRLDEHTPLLSANQTFKGSALGQHLRDAAIENPSRDFALILISAERKIKSLYHPDKTAHDLFDRVYVKEEINSSRNLIRSQLLSLCKGYVFLRSMEGTFDLSKLLNSSEQDQPYIDQQELRTKIDEAKAPHIASRVILNLIDRPGPLLSTAGACAYLGIDLEDGHKIEGILDKFQIRYLGIFSEGWTRWWNNRLESWATTVFGRRATGLTAAQRANILSEKFQIQLNPAKSAWNHSTDELISFSCASCERGTELRHSVAAFEPASSRYLFRKRICWDCIQTDKNISHDPPILVDDSDRALAEQVKSKPRETGQEHSQ